MLDRATREKLVIQSLLKQFKEEKQMPTIRTHKPMTSVQKTKRDTSFIYQDMQVILGEIAEQQRIIDAAEEAEEKKDELECKFIKLINELLK